MLLYSPDKEDPPVLGSKDPRAENKPYTVDLRRKRYIPDSASITGASAGHTGDVSLIISAVTNDADTVTVWLSGGSQGSTPLVSVTFVTDLDNGKSEYYSDTVSFYVPIDEQ